MFLQDLTVDMDTGHPTCWGGIWRYGRAKWEQGKTTFRFEWSFFRDSSTGVHVEADPSEAEWSFVVSARDLFFLAAAVSDRRLPQPDTGDFSARTLSVSAHGGSIFWEVWKDPHSWSRADGWRNSSFHWVDWILGQPVHESEVVDVVDAAVPMPEANYPVKVTLTRDSWRRPRGFRTLTRRRAQIDVKPNTVKMEKAGCIPTPKDGIYSLSCDAATVADAVAQTVRRVLSERERRGGSVRWVPSTV